MSAADKPCRIDSHPDRAAIDQAIVNGKSQREIARTFRIGYHADDPDPERFYPDNKIVARHIDKCLGEAYRVAKADDVAATGRALLGRLAGLDVIIDEQLDRLREGIVIMDGDTPALNPDGSPKRRYLEADIRGAIREARRNLELRSRLAGATPEGDMDAADDARRALQSPQARLLISNLESFLGEQAAQSDGSIQGN